MCTTLCGSLTYIGLYVAPEIVDSKPYTAAVGWWALGILVVEMLCGFPPSEDRNEAKLSQKILFDDI
jgi:serine/threonine protein kinase